MIDSGRDDDDDDGKTEPSFRDIHRAIGISFANIVSSLLVNRVRKMRRIIILFFPPRSTTPLLLFYLFFHPTRNEKRQNNPELSVGRLRRRRRLV